MCELDIADDVRRSFCLRELLGKLLQVFQKSLKIANFEGAYLYTPLSGSDLFAALSQVVHGFCTGLNKLLDLTLINKISGVGDLFAKLFILFRKWSSPGLMDTF